MEDKNTPKSMEDKYEFRTTLKLFLKAFEKQNLELTKETLALTKESLAKLVLPGEKANITPLSNEIYDKLNAVFSSINPEDVNQDFLENFNDIKVHMIMQELFTYDVLRLPEETKKEIENKFQKYKVEEPINAEKPTYSSLTDFFNNLESPW